VDNHRNHLPYSPCLIEEETGVHVVTAMRARELGRRAVAVGDNVDLVGHTDGAPDTLARIVRTAPRRSVLRRSADDTDPAERVLVANADQLIIVCAMADPLPRTGFIDRCLVAAYTGDLDPVLVLTKADLADPRPLQEAYTDLELPILVTQRPSPVTGNRAIQGIEAVRHRLDRAVSVMMGHSGVGKSTLVNALVPDAKRATGAVTGVGKGRHTSTSAIALPLRAGGWVIDTPGVRSPARAGSCTSASTDPNRAPSTAPDNSPTSRRPTELMRRSMASRARRYYLPPTAGSARASPSVPSMNISPRSSNSTNTSCISSTRMPTP